MFIKKWIAPWKCAQTRGTRPLYMPYTLVCDPLRSALPLGHKTLGRRLETSYTGRLQLQRAGLHPGLWCSIVMVACCRVLVAFPSENVSSIRHILQSRVREAQEEMRTQLPWTGSLNRRMLMTQTSTQITAMTCAHA